MCASGTCMNFWPHLTYEFGKYFFYTVVLFCVYITPVKFQNFLWQNEYSTKLSLSSVLGQISVRFWKNHLTHFTKHFSVIFKSKMKFGMSSFTQDFRIAISIYRFFCTKILIKCAKSGFLQLNEFNINFNKLFSGNSFWRLLLKYLRTIGISFMNYRAV